MKADQIERQPSRFRDWLRQHPSARVAMGRVASAVEKVVWGTAVRERVLTTLLKNYYRSTYRRDWYYSAEVPHFFNQRAGIFLFGFDIQPTGPYSLYRGFFSSEVVRDGDNLLDVGCGDGFFTSRFLAPRCAHVDAIDIERSAIVFAKKWNSAANISYSQGDIVSLPLPARDYDVIVWDGGIGHVSAHGAGIALEKIRGGLKEGGAFVGSESLGHEGLDHLQFFATREDLCALLSTYFRYVEVRVVKYSIGRNLETLREEAYWRCANERLRFRDLHWGSCGSDQGSE